MNRQTAEQKAEVEARRAKVAELLLQRVSPAEIARRLGCSKQVVYNDTLRARRHWRTEAVGSIGEKIADELTQLEADEGRLRERWELTEDTMLWLRIYDRILELMKRRAAMLGLDSPDELRLEPSTLLDVVGQLARVVVEHVTDLQVRALIAGKVDEIASRFMAGSWSPARKSINSGD